ncbi:MAG: DEAD/DEAH box helicase, partial [Planctomycetota bacterium]
MPGPAEIDAAGRTAAALDPRVAEVLRRWWGFETLRPLQAEAIAAALAGRDSLVVMPTGGGKSLCYQLPPLVGDTTDVVISPLVALMKDQVDS